jgi:CDP-paratose 2-epimerase
MEIAIITGSAGLIGSEAVRFFSSRFDIIIGIDNNYRAYFFGDNASTEWNRLKLETEIGNYKHYDADIREYAALEKIFKEYGRDIKLIVHTAAQPSHDWAAKEPLTDFTVNANGTMNLLELTRLYSEKAVFIFTSTNKVYGDRPNSLPLVELEQRWEIDTNHPYYKNGIDESMSIDNSKHSLFGASKVSADILAQEYGKYFSMNVGIFRGGCLTGPQHSGTQLHGFLSYLMKCAISGDHYTVFGYKGKQVRDNIHSLDLVNMFWNFYLKPRQGEVYNAGGGRFSNCSMKEAIVLCEEITGKKMNYSYSETNRIGDHIWWISDVSKFKSHYPDWNWQFDIKDILTQIHDGIGARV